MHAVSGTVILVLVNQELDLDWPSCCSSTAIYMIVKPTALLYSHHISSHAGYQSIPIIHRVVRATTFNNPRLS